MPLTPQQSQKLRYFRLLAGISALAFAIAIFFFSPVFAFWRGLYVVNGPPMHTPEVNRAQRVLEQLHDPFIRTVVGEQSNRVILWRLLFPIVGHYLFFPDWLFLAIPFIGCFLVLGYVAHVMMVERRDFWWALCAAVIAGTGSWFFVSTGWLTYADSWYILGLLVISFARSRVALVSFCVLEPFVDERFVLSLPLALVMRMIYFDLFDSRKRRDLLRDAIAIAIPSALYVLLRLILLKRSDSSSQAYIDDQWSALKQVSAATYLHGLWMGMRAAWLLVIVLVWLVFRRRKWLASALLIAAILLGIVTSLFLAADIGRSSSTLYPAGILGIILLIRQRPALARYALPSIMLANLALPAEHVLTVFSRPIFYLHAEIDRYLNPPDFLQSAVYVRNGEALIDRNRFQEARETLDVAVALDRKNHIALLNRAIASLGLNDLARAAADADTVLRINPNLADALFVRGIVYGRQADAPNARRMLQNALAAAPQGWPHRAECEKALRDLDPPKAKSDFGL